MAISPNISGADNSTLAGLPGCAKRRPDQHADNRHRSQPAGHNHLIGWVGAGHILAMRQHHADHHQNSDRSAVYQGLHGSEKLSFQRHVQTGHA